MPGPSEIEQTADTNPVDHEMMMCLPGQVCEDLCVAGPSKMKKTQHADPVDPELPPVPDPSSCDLDGSESLLLCFMIFLLFSTFLSGYNSDTRTSCKVTSCS